MSQLKQQTDQSNYSTQSKIQKMKNLPKRVHQSQQIKKIEMSQEEEIMQKKISSVENIQLQRVFGLLCVDNLQENEKESQVVNNEQDDKSKQQQNIMLSNDLNRKYFTADDLQKILNQLGFETTKHEIDLMIWEVDEDLDKRISWDEFQLMYKRCIYDKTGLEPRRLFTLVEFLMFDKQERHFITIEDTLELLYVKTISYKSDGAGSKDLLNEEIYSLFPKDQQKLLQTGEEQKINFSQYYEKMMQKALEQNKARQEAKKQNRRSGLNKDDDD